MGACCPHPKPNRHDLVSLHLRVTLLHEWNQPRTKEGWLRGWKYIEPSTRPRMNVETNTELGNDPAPQLYDLIADPGETTNVATKYPATVKEMDDLLKATGQGR